ncbi:hypothetical protein sS8_0818 [Methylocaldum marinum]|uniref:Uncharacterized protein n=1 Tax=Methylocaldum marinum TaxID=1432792 RepID=A0A250KM75_9GAMM|nr:hypothetical protein [Methylocaldum marinum]BBA32783.1 hypothetical protein sS8_0818 [Methylocaldum marinum]
MQISRKLGFILILFSFVFLRVALAGGPAESGNVDNTELVTLIRHPSDRFFDGNLTVNELQNKLSVTAERAENKESWYLNSVKYKLRVTAEARSITARVDALELHSSNTRQLALKDIEKIFGHSRGLARSRDAWVKFDSWKRNNDGHISVTAQLYGPPENESTTCYNTQA